jgi:hypothetical protein
MISSSFPFMEMAIARGFSECESSSILRMSVWLPQTDWAAAGRLLYDALKNIEATIAAKPRTRRLNLAALAVRMRVRVSAGCLLRIVMVLFP